MFVALASACNETRAGTNGYIEKGRGGNKKKKKETREKDRRGEGKNRTRGGTKKKDRIREEKG